MDKKIILVTGGNSGLGFQCCTYLAKLDNVHVILAGRSPERVNDAVEKVRESAAATSVVEAGIVDLSSFESIRKYCESLIARGIKFYSIACNAGIQPTEKRMTVDGFESAFGTNHLGHFLLVSLLRERVAKRIVVVSSETHDPNEAPGLPTPAISDLDALARGLEPFYGQLTYGTSKLCNLLFAKEFARRYPTGPEVLAFTPGLTPDTGLFREGNHVLWPLMVAVIRVTMWFINGRVSTSEYSGSMMAKAAVDDPMPFGAKSSDYIRVDEVYEASETAKNPELGRLLWEKSEKWVSK